MQRGRKVHIDWWNLSICLEHEIECCPSPLEWIYLVCLEKQIPQRKFGEGKTILSSLGEHSVHQVKNKQNKFIPASKVVCSHLHAGATPQPGSDWRRSKTSLPPRNLDFSFIRVKKDVFQNSCRLISQSPGLTRILGCFCGFHSMSWAPNPNFLIAALLGALLWLQAEANQTRASLRRMCGTEFWIDPTHYKIKHLIHAELINNEILSNPSRDSDLMFTCSDRRCSVSSVMHTHLQKFLCETPL